jgi:hypothetical protein
MLIAIATWFGGHSLAPLPCFSDTMTLRGGTFLGWTSYK